MVQGKCTWVEASGAATEDWQSVPAEEYCSIAVAPALGDMVASANMVAAEVDMAVLVDTAVLAGMVAVEDMGQDLAESTTVVVFASAPQPTHRKPRS